jgi:hypothetical protein
VKTVKPHVLALLVFLILGFVWTPGSASAIQDVVFDSVMVDLWPEDEQPSVLVIYEIELAQSVTLPQVLTLQIPANAEIQTVASRDEEKHLVPLEWQASGTGELLDVQFTTQNPEIRLEYYDPTIIRQGANRSFTFRWTSLYPVNDLSIYIQQPYGAGELTTDPEMTQVATMASNCSYYMLEAGSVGAGIPYELTFQYNKNIANLAYPVLEVFAAAPITRSTAGRAASILSVVLGLMVIAMAVMLLVGLYYLRFRKKKDLQVKGGGPDGVVINPDKRAVFCHECGSRSRAGDAYCRNCGTELRRFD